MAGPATAAGVNQLFSNAVGFDRDLTALEARAAQIDADLTELLDANQHGLPSVGVRFTSNNSRLYEQDEAGDGLNLVGRTRPTEVLRLLGFDEERRLAGDIGENDTSREVGKFLVARGVAKPRAYSLFAKLGSDFHPGKVLFGELKYVADPDDLAVHPSPTNFEFVDVLTYSDPRIVELEDALDDLRAALHHPALYKELDWSSAAAPEGAYIFVRQKVPGKGSFQVEVADSREADWHQLTEDEILELRSNGDTPFGAAGEDAVNTTFSASSVVKLKSSYWAVAENGQVSWLLKLNKGHTLAVGIS